MKKPRRNFGTDQKAAILKRYLVDKVPVSDLCDEYDIKPNQLSAAFEELTSRETSLSAKIVQEESQARHTGDTEAEVATALNVVHRLVDLVAETDGSVDADRLDLAGQAFKLTNARLFLRFRPVQIKKRLLNKLAGGVVVFGAAPDPIEIYRGPTGRRALNYNGSTAPMAAEPGKPGLPSPPECTVGSGSEDKSLGNVSRGDWIRTSDLLTPSLCAGVFSQMVGH